jgi:hypothetical protein
MKDAYLSIDLDYWSRHKTTRSANTFFEKVFAIRRPIIVVSQHHLMLRDINKKNYKLLYNIDFHSDIAEPGLWLNEGTWVCYVKWRKNATFEWRYPDYQDCFVDGWGLCNSDHMPETKSDPFTYKNLHSWQIVKHSEGVRGLQWGRIDRVNICLTNPDTVRDVLSELRRRGYTKNLSHRGRKFYKKAGL